MKMIKVIAIDDEPLALQLIVGYIKKTPFLEFCGAFDNPLDAFDIINNENVDLMFLDIQMPDISGIEFVRTLPEGTKVIFTTAHEKYAIEGYKLDVIDYLLKPFGYEEFLKASQKAFRIIESDRKGNTSISTNNEFLFLKSEYKIKRINFSEILYIEGMKDYVKIYIKNESKPILSISSIKALEMKLPENQFMRIHRSFIVNLESVNTVERSRVVYGKVYIPVSDQYKANFQEFLSKNFL